MGWKTQCQKAEGSAGQADALLMSLFRLWSSLQGGSMETAEAGKYLSAHKLTEVVTLACASWVRLAPAPCFGAPSGCRDEGVVCDKWSL